MKIGLLGNMNNMMFPLARYLQDRGYEVKIYLLEEFEHFHPEADTFDDVNVPIIPLHWTSANFPLITKKMIRDQWLEHDVLIGTNYAPAFTYKGGLQLDIFFPAGSDLFERPFIKLIQKWPPRYWYIFDYSCSRHQYMGIRHTRFISMNPSNDDLEIYLKKVKIKGKRIPAVPFLYLPQYTEDYFKKSKVAEQVQEIRSKYDLIFVQQSRQEWTLDPKSFHYKGNEKLLKAFVSFVKRNKATKACLILFSYGSDVDASKQFLKENGVESNVIWFPKMLRKDLMAVLQIADIGIGQLGRSWFSYSSIYELIAIGKPVIHHRDDSLYIDQYPDLYPMVSAKTEEKVLETFEDYMVSKEKYIEMGKMAEKWFEKYAINLPVDTIVNIIEEKKVLLNGLSGPYRSHSLFEASIVVIKVMVYITKKMLIPFGKKLKWKEQKAI